MVSVSSGFSLSMTVMGILPAPPVSLLLLGQETDTAAEQLSRHGYLVQTSPLFRPQAFTQFPTATRQGVYSVEIDVTSSSAGSVCFAGVLVLDLSPQIHPLALFDQLSRVVGQDGLVVLTGPDPQATPSRVVRWLDYVVAIGSRCGFAALDLDEVCASPDGNGSFVRAFRKATIPRWQLHHLRPHDYPEIAVLFQEVFGHPLSRELWEWKYANGHGNAVLASRDGVLVAHYGGMYRDILLCGKPDWAYGGSDVMVHPKERGVMTKQGPFLLTAATTAEIYGPVAYGFPTERAMLVAERMGLYAKAGRMAEVRWEPAAPRARLRTHVRALAKANVTDQAIVDGVWRAMAHDLRDGVVGVRDWKYLEQRYFAHPHNQYEALAVVSRFTGKALGVMVLRRLEGSCELLDIVAPLANVAIVVDQARRLTARWALPYLYCWITSNYASVFVACGGKEQELNVFIPTSCWTDDPRVDMLKDRWWLTSGDTDFR
jgi:hypothetical protein